MSPIGSLLHPQGSSCPFTSVVANRTSRSPSPDPPALFGLPFDEVQPAARTTSQQKRAAASRMATLLARLTPPGRPSRLRALMSVSIRMARQGSKKKPFYRIVATDRRSPRDGRFIEQIGYYDPRKPEFRLDHAKYQAWVKNGARRSDTVSTLVKANPPKA